MSGPLRAVIRGAALLGASGAAAVAVIFAVAFTAGKSIAAGERALLIAAAADLLVGLAAVVVFARATRGLTAGWRVLATAVFALLELVVLAAILLVTVVLLNR